MKKGTIIFGILFLLFSCTMAQVPKVFDPVRDLNILEMNKYIGTWEWKSNNASFTLILRKWKAGDDLYFINGWYRFIKDGKIIANRLDSLNKVKYSGLTGAIMKGNDSLEFTFTDITREELTRGTLNFINGNSNRILFKLKSGKRHQPHIQFRNTKRHVFTDKIPYDLDMIMTRIE